MTPIAGGDPKVTEDADVDQNGDGTDGTRGYVSYQWAADDTDTAGLFLSVWRVTFSGGEIQSYPNGGYVLVRITPAEFPTSADYLTVEQLKKTRQLAGHTYADDDIGLAIGAASRGIDALCARRFWKDETDVTRYYSPRASNLVLIDDLAAVTSVASGEASTFTDTWARHQDYDLYPLNAEADGRPWTRLEPGAYGRCFPTGPRTIQVVGKFGWPTIPEPIRQATGILASMLLLRHREAVFGVILAGAEIGAIARIARDDPQVTFLTRPFVRKASA